MHTVFPLIYFSSFTWNIIFNVIYECVNGMHQFIVDEKYHKSYRIHIFTIYILIQYINHFCYFMIFTIRRLILYASLFLHPETGREDQLKNYIYMHTYILQLIMFWLFDELEAAHEYMHNFWFVKVISPAHQWLY